MNNNWWSRSWLCSWVGLCAFLVSVSVGTVRGNECTDGAIELYQDQSLLSALGSMLGAYAQQCNNFGDCTVEMDEELQAYMIKTAMELNEQVQAVEDGATAAVPNIGVPPNAVFEVEAEFSLLFGDIPSVSSTMEAYVETCEQSGMDTKIVCVDELLDLEGDVDSFGVVDFKIKVDTLPLCLPRTCKDEDLADVSEEIVKKAVFAIAEAGDIPMAPLMILNVATVELACLFSGLDTCIYTAEPVLCPAETSEPSLMQSDPPTVAPSMTTAPTVEEEEEEEKPTVKEEAKGEESTTIKDSGTTTATILEDPSSSAPTTRGMVFGIIGAVLSMTLTVLEMAR